MIIGGLQKTSLIDYPEKVAAVVFLTGCNFSCPFCYNPDLIPLNSKPVISEEKFWQFLEDRKKVLDAVCISGGEPTVQSGLIDFIKNIKAMGFLVKLDTNGSNPALLQKVLKQKLVDYVAMDIKFSLKSPVASLQSIFRINDTVIKNIQKSIKIIMDSDIDYEFRTTVVPLFHKKENIVEIAKIIKGAKKYFLQKFLPAPNLKDNALRAELPYSDKEMKSMAEECRKYVLKCEIR